MNSYGLTKEDQLSDLLLWLYIPFDCFYCNEGK